MEDMIKKRWCSGVIIMFYIIIIFNPVIIIGEEIISLNDLIQTAYENNPAIKAAKQGWLSKIEKYRLKTSYPDPQIMTTYFTEPIETKLGPQDWNINISQKIPFPGKLSKAGEIVKTDVKVARLNYDKSIRNITTLVQESYYELLYIRKAIEIANQNEKLIDHLKRVVENAYANDRGIFMDLVKAESQKAQLQYDKLLLKEIELTEITKINSLLNNPPDKNIGKLETYVPGKIVYSLEEIYKLALQYQEDIKIANTKVDKADLSIKLAKYENLPNFKVGFFYASIGKPDGVNIPEDAGDDALGIQAGITIPLWTGKNISRVSKAKADFQKAKAMQNDLVNKTYAKIRALFFKVNNSKRIMDLYQKELLPQAAQSAQLAETWFKEKQGSFSDFIEIQAVWYNFQLTYERAKADYGKYLAKLERVVGQQLTVKNESSEN